MSFRVSSACAIGRRAFRWRFRRLRCAGSPMRFGAWAFGRRAGFYAGLALATCIGLFLFTRFQIPDVTLTLTITLALWAFLARSRKTNRIRASGHTLMCGALSGSGLLLKGLIAAVFPIAAALLYLLHAQWRRASWRRLRPVSRSRAAAGDCRALAHSGDAAESALFRFHDAQRAGRISWLLLVLLHQRAPAAVSESAVSARLQHGSAPVLLGVPSAVAVPLERVFPAAASKLDYRPVDRASRMRLLACAGPDSSCSSSPSPPPRSIIRCHATRRWRC